MRGCQPHEEPASGEPILSTRTTRVDSRMIATTLVAAIWGASAPLGALAGSPTSDAGIVRQFSELGGKPYSVGYNERSMLVGGKPVLLMSGSAHYVRSTPEMWPEIFAKMKASGLNAVESCEWPASKLTAAAPSLLATVPCACHSQRVCGCRWAGAARCVLELPRADTSGPYGKHPRLYWTRERHTVPGAGCKSRSVCCA